MLETVRTAFTEDSQREYFVEDIRTEGSWRDVRMSPGAGARGLSNRRSRVVGLL